MDPNKPEPAPKGTGREITPLVIKDLELRSKMGAEKYGETLRAFNGRDALVDAYQEALDLVQYLRQAIEEKQAKQESVTLFMPSLLPIFSTPFLTGPDRQTAREFIGKPGAAAARAAAETRLIEEGHTTREKLDAEAAEIKEKLETFANTYMKESIAQEAHRLVLGDRGEAYGHPIFDMTRSADMLTALLRNKLRPGARLEAEDIGQAMICVKQSRHRNKPKRDNNTDTAGYAITLEMIAEWRAANPGVDPRDVFPAA